MSEATAELTADLTARLDRALTAAYRESQHPRGPGGQWVHITPEGEVPPDPGSRPIPPDSARADESLAADNPAAWPIVQADPRWEALGMTLDEARHAAGAGQDPQAAAGEDPEASFLERLHPRKKKGEKGGGQFTRKPGGPLIPEGLVPLETGRRRPPNLEYTPGRPVPPLRNPLIPEGQTPLETPGKGQRLAQVKDQGGTGGPGDWHADYVEPAAGWTPDLTPAPGVKDLTSKGRPAPPAKGTADDPVDVNGNIDQALVLMRRGLHVRLNQPDEIAVLLHKVDTLTQHAKARQLNPPNWDFGQLTVKGTNLFTAQHQGIPRIRMPQFSGLAQPGTPAAKLAGGDGKFVDLTPQLAAKLKADGIAVTPKTVPAAHLRATQTELVGAKVAGFAAAVERGVPKAVAALKEPIYVTRDHYVVDGHHRWAANMMLDSLDGVLGNDTYQNVLMVDMDIGAMIPYSNQFAADMGIAGRGGVAKKTAAALAGMRADLELRLTEGPSDTPGAAMQIGASSTASGADPAAAVGHEKLGHTQQGLWHHKGMQLPAFIQHVAKDLHEERGMPLSQAIATAISQCKKWAAGGEGVKPETRAKAAEAIAEWERLKAQSKLTKGAAAEDAPGLPQLVTIPGVDLLAAGTWHLSTGRQTFTRDDLQAAVDAARCPAVGNPVIKIGHLDTRFAPAPDADGEPAIGRVTNMRLADNGAKIIGDLAGMPGWLGAITASAYPRRSVEGKYGFTCQIGHKHPFAVTALALLGVTPPGVGVLSGLDDVAKLYGLTAAAAEWRTDPIDPEQEQAMPVTEEDVRRAFYATAGAPHSWWITELQMAPTQLIIADETDGRIYRVPFTIGASGVEFGTPDEVASYEDVAASRGTGPVMVYASMEESRSVEIQAAWDAAAAVKAMGDQPSPAAIKAMFAIPGQSKTDSSLPHHDCAGGKVGAANPDGCSAAIAALNGARGGLKGVSASAKKTAWSHLAAHLREAGRTPPDLQATAGQDPDVEAAGDVPGPQHGPMTGEHSHPHAAHGSQGGDETHDHPHRHTNDGVHDHVHEPAAAAPAAATTPQGGSEVEFTEQHKAAIRARLGKSEGDDFTLDEVVAALDLPRAPTVAATAGDDGNVEVPQITDGTYLVDSEILKGYQERALAGDRAVRAMVVGERDQVLAAAVQQGKFAQSRLEHFKQLWDKDPDGTRRLVDSLAAGLVPMAAAGSNGDYGLDPDLPGDFENQDAYRRLYPDDVRGARTPAPGVRTGGF